MYNVLLVDDEINILEGIAALVDWEKCGTTLQVKAFNGQMAFEFIKDNPPDIVITDIKMPGLNGVELIQRVHRIYPDIKFIVLSGYDEFQFAKTAMECNVKHYLLKPSNEKKIEAALQQVVADLEEQQRKQVFMENMRSHLQKVMPKAKEQFLKDYITNKKYNIQDWESYSQLFDLNTNSTEFRLIVLAVDEAHEYEQQFALKQMVTGEMGKNRDIPLSTTIGEKIVLLAEDVPLPELTAKLKETKQTYKNFYQKTFTTAISDPGGIGQLRSMYNEALNCLTQRFYLANGSIITVQDIGKEAGRFKDLQYDHEDLILAVRSGNTDVVHIYLTEFFDDIRCQKYEAGLVKSHSLEMYMSIIRQAGKGDMDHYFQQVIFFQQYERFDEIKQFIISVAEEITNYHYERTKQTQTNIIRRVVAYVEENLADTELSLTKIAAEVLYMNPDYLGKLFKKEKGERFSNFLISRRIESAIDIIKDSEQVKVFEVAEAVGFGNNPRYFGQVFKKYTGVTPTEFKNKSEK
ncbi:response regulator transcription factor [Sediminibacillus albus]|uniref:Two-component system, response regulator YesN n=1 Tax=Sediminibacillus albus TaxID=407036 RepID=A0A1G8WIB6_9BACI|nr:response regulator [Sediminibacillus albus]SDJ77896.1 two-component system, response regulator YesN [Sediminibacillus albus]